MHRMIDAVHDGNPLAQPADVLDLEGHVEEAIAIEVPECIDRVELRGHHESLAQTSGDQSAVCPQGKAAKRTRRELSGDGSRANEEGDGEERLGIHTGTYALPPETRLDRLR